MQNIFIVAGLSLLLCSCSKNSSNIDVKNDSLAAVNYQNVSYGSDPQQSADIYLPVGRNDKTRTIVVIHGGAWVEGDKSAYTSYISELSKKLPEYAFANLNYRLATGDANHFPAQEEDIQSAIAFLNSKSADYTISREYIYIGLSAGAHLAMLQGYRHTDVVRPKGIISFFGPTDLTELYQHSDTAIPRILKMLMGTTPAENPGAYAEASPLTYITASAPPTLIFHGSNDPIVPVQQANLLHAKLDSVNVSNQLIIYPGQGHGWVGADLTDSFDRIAAFIKGL